MANSVEFSAVAQLIADKLGLPLPVVIALTIAGMLGWVCWRTRSTHVLISRIWRLIYGKTAMADREIGKFIENRNRLVTFRFFSGLPVRTLPQAKRLIQWSTVNNEEIADIRACGDLFDLEACRLNVERIPGRFARFAMWLAALVLTVMVVLSAAGGLTDRALLQFKESKKWFLISEQSATPWAGSGVLTKKDCIEATGTQPVTTSFASDEATVICKALRDADMPAFIKQTVAQQRLLFSITGMFLFYWAWVFWAEFRRGNFANNMKRRIEARAQSTDPKAGKPGPKALLPDVSASPKLNESKESEEPVISS